jgi:lipid II:glycine glycyltransferase (peptidoglycan interpeptide bridge formation enzyme)
MAQTLRRHQKSLNPHEVGGLSDIRQSPDFAKFMGKIGWEEVNIGPVRAFIRKTPLLGAVIRIPRPNLPLPLEEIDQLARERRALLVKIEPNFLLNGFNPQVMGKLRKDRSPILPTRTIWIDLTKSLEHLQASFDKDTRNLARRAEKEGVVVFESNDLKSFYELWEDTARRKGFYIPFQKEMEAVWQSFSGRHLLSAKLGGKIVAAVMLFGYKEAIYYYFAASSEAGRKVYAPYLLMWAVIKRAKDWGYKRLDLEGISDPAVKHTHSWAGFSHFKKGFGGQEVHYVGSFSKYYSPLGKIIGRFL